VTEARANEQTMWNRAFHDGLTGLANRALLLEHLQRTIAHAKRRTGAGYAVLFLDLDQFKQINDGIGHVLADAVLAQVAHRLSACVRPEDVVARLGGDEFAVLLSGVRSPKSLLALTDRIHRALDTPIIVDGHVARVSTSIGAALGGAGYQRPDELLRDADIAMYEAKSQGRSHTAVFEPRMRERIIRTGVG
jgi:diguanylate cyclase (GGDEF)-like protein